MPVGKFALGPPPGPAALTALPLVGAVVGALAGTLGWIASLALSHALAAAVALGAVIVLTGAMHVDGFLDGCDAFIASVSPERRLEILKDPRHGTFAVAGMFVAGSLWLAALAALPPKDYPADLAFAGALARAAVVPNAFRFPYARANAPTEVLGSRPAALPLMLIFVALLAAAYVLAPALVLLVPAAVLGGWVVASWAAGRLGGGLVGDAYGFAIVILEIGVLIALAAGVAPGRE
ncbi:MAG: adenosylcobinamide-GDP ribazoletransferase [Candidatus Eremiobacteraeota bacterium]|nr:adenosylcobinamide-GDP ribazoletransferase [Candidatus Eremiobacteraeota bacterium]